MTDQVRQTDNATRLAVYIIHHKVWYAACGKKTQAPRRKYALHLPIYLKLTSVRRQVNLIGWTKADNNSRAHQLGEGSQREAENACVIT